MGVLITDNIIPFQSESVFYERAKLKGPQYKHRYYIYAIPSIFAII